MGNIEEFRDYRPEDVEADIAANKKGSLKGSIVGTSDLPQGESRLFILPGTMDMPMPWVTWYEHAIKNPVTGKTVFFNCTIREGACRGCQWVKRLESEGATEKAIKEALAKQRIAVNARFTLWGNGAVPEERAGVKIFKFGPGILKGNDRKKVGGLQALLQELNFTHPERGCDIKIVKSGQGMDTSYDVSFVTVAEKTSSGRTVQVPDTHAIGTAAEIKAILADRHDLSRMTKTRSIDDQDALLRGDAPARGQMGGGQRRPALNKGSTLQDEFGDDDSSDEDRIPF